MCLVFKRGRYYSVRELVGEGRGVDFLELCAQGRL